MVTLIIILHVLVGIILLLLILLQMGRGASLSALVGGSSESPLAGPGGDIFLKKITVILSIIFAVTSLSLSLFYRGERSLLERVPAPMSAPAPPPVSE